MVKGWKVDDQCTMEGQSVLPVFSRPPLPRREMTVLVFAWGKWSRTELFSRGFFHIPKELKRNMECLETAVISQEGDKGDIQFASKLPKIIREEKKEQVIQSITFVQKSRLCICHTFSLCYRNLSTVECKRERQFKITWCSEENTGLGLKT